MYQLYLLFLQKIEESGHYKSNMVRFCYNAISDYECFSSTLEHFLENPLELAWLDLSFNDLSTIDKVLKLVLFCGYQPSLLLKMISSPYCILLSASLHCVLIHVRPHKM